MRALDVIQSAYERCNRLSPGETLSADDAAFGLRRLNEIVDELSAKGQFLYRDVLTSAAQTGHITLGSAPWTAIEPGAEIISATVDGLPMSSPTMTQYSEIPTPTDTGSPYCYAHDGFATVYLYPVATGQTITLHTRVGVAEFADQTTSYTVPPGYQAALGAALAVAIAPNILGRLPPELVATKQRLMAAISRYSPAIVDVHSYTCPTRAAGRILTGY